MGPQGPVAPFLKACSPPKEAVSPEGDIAAVAREDEEESATTGEGDRTPGEGGARAPSSGVEPVELSHDGLSHHGDPAEPEVKGEGKTQGTPSGAEEENEIGTPAKLVRAPRSPSQSERELHEAVHLPHAEWCEYCVRGRARHKPHKCRNSNPSSRTKVEVT